MGYRYAKDTSNQRSIIGSVERTIPAMAQEVRTGEVQKERASREQILSVAMARVVQRASQTTAGS